MKRAQASELVPMASAGQALVVTPHPITLQGQRSLDAAAAPLMPGETLATFLARHGVLPGQQWVVSLGGVDVPEKHWGRVRPKNGHLIEARRVPERDVLRIVAIAVLAYYTMGTGGMGSGGLFASMGSVAGYAAAAVVFYAGATMINRVLGPQAQMAGDLSSGMSSSPTYSIGGGRNRLRQFEPMALVLGEPYCVPDLAAQPYTYFANGEQYLWQLMHAGINCTAIKNMRIGDTAISSYQNVNLSYEGFLTGNTGLPMLSNVDTIAGALLDAPGGTGPWVTRTSSLNAIELALDIEGTVFQVDSGSGEYRALTCHIQTEYRLVGASTWETFYVSPPVAETVAGHQEQDPATGETYWVEPYQVIRTPTTIEITNANTRPVRLTYRKTVSPGQYEIRARKLSANETASNKQNVIQWSTLKTYQLDAGDYRGQSRVGIQIQASGQLNGSLDEVNWIATAKTMPYWNGSDWISATGRENGLSNPGALILLLGRGIYSPATGQLIAGLGLSDEQIDIEALKRFMVWCASKNFTYDYFLQENTAIGDLLESIAQAGLGSITYHSGKLGVIWFSDEQPVECVMNMATTKVNSFSVTYTTAMSADELEVQYFDRDRNYSWKSVRVTAPGVTSPSSTARITLQGVTSESHAAVLGRFFMAQNVYQRKSITAEVDLEHLTFRRGTVMALSHDLTQWGYGGRVKSAVNSAGTVTLTLDDVVPSASPSGAVSRYIGLRLSGEDKYRVFPVAAFSGSTRTITLASAWPSGVDLPGAGADNPAHDALWIYDFKSVPGQKIRVAEVNPNGNLGGASVLMVPESAEFWDYVWSGNYAPPPNNSLLQPAPQITSVHLSEQLGRQGNTYYSELTVTYEVSGSYERAELWGAVDDGIKSQLAASRSMSMSWRGGLNETWRLEVRAYSGLRVARYLFEYTVKGLSEPPPNVTGFMIDGNRLVWDEVSAVDLAGYKIRFNYGNYAWWDTAQPLHQGLLTSSPYEPGQLPINATFLIKAVDTSGIESAIANTVVGSQNTLQIRNILQTWDQADFAGTITGGAVSDGVLKANATDSFYGPPDAPFYGGATDPFYVESTYGALVYQFDILVMEPGRVLLDYLVTGPSFKIEYLRRSNAAFYGAAGDYFYGAAGDPFYGTPNDFLIWPGQLETSGPEVLTFRLSIEAGKARGQIVLLKALLDVPDIFESLNDVPISAGGTRLVLSKSVHQIKSIQLTVQTDGGDAVTARYAEKNSPLGPLVYTLNSAGEPIAGTVDADITSY